MNPGLAPDTIARFVELALFEDMGRGDITTQATTEPSSRASGTLVFRRGGVVCGLPIAAAIFRFLDSASEFQLISTDGAVLADGASAAQITGKASALLSGERVALNIVARLSATASLTRQFVERVSGTHARILDTRKTTPGLRVLEKYAVRMGGGSNHRMGLDDGVLIKDNHIRIAGSVTRAVDRARRYVPPGLRIEVEVETREELEEAISAGAGFILLDNMSAPLLREAVRLVNGRALLEASGGITLANVQEVAETGVDFISVGALTHSAGSLDVSLEVQ